MWDARTAVQAVQLNAHADRVVSLAWHPSPAARCVATASADSTAKLWALSEAGGSCVAELRGHSDRLSAVRWHPHGGYVVTTSYDLTWRLWDVATGVEVLLQVCAATECA